MKKRKPAYSLLGNIRYVLSLLMQDSPADTLCILLAPLIQVAAPYLAMLLRWRWLRWQMAIPPA